ncbi:MAG: hypothetical protein JXQ71_16185 [Verrucomicrobia bacterium]|nr:hypothetical protein [Verrucomicrobiota bacterium]
MNFDLRLPIGLLFTFYGVVLVIVGLTTDKELYERSLGININIIWGLVLFVFGATMLLLSLKSARRPPPPPDSRPPH